MNKELLKKAEELLPKERNIVVKEDIEYNQALSDSRQALPAIIELVREEMRGAFNRMFADLVQENKSNDIKIPESYAYIYDLLNRSQQNNLLDK